jgi:hypothetical protein
MPFKKKQKVTSNKKLTPRDAPIADTSAKSPYSKQNIKKKFNEFGDTDSF